MIFRLFAILLYFLVSSCDDKLDISKAENDFIISSLFNSGDGVRPFVSRWVDDISLHVSFNGSNVNYKELVVERIESDVDFLEREVLSHSIDFVDGPANFVFLFVDDVFEVDMGTFGNLFNLVVPSGLDVDEYEGFLRGQEGKVDCYTRSSFDDHRNIVFTLSVVSNNIKRVEDLNNCISVGFVRGLGVYGTYNSGEVKSVLNKSSNIYSGADIKILKFVYNGGVFSGDSIDIVSSKINKYFSY